MKCLILAAGYATRLYPLTENFPKPLLKVGEKSILDWLVDDLVDTTDIDEFVVISNHKFAQHFEDWKSNKKRTRPYEITVIDDGTSTNETRLGAVKDIQLAVEKLNLADDLLVMAGDNVLDFSLSKFVKFAKEKNTRTLPWKNHQSKLTIAEQNQRIAAYLAEHKELDLQKKYSDRKNDEKARAAFDQMTNDGVERKFDCIIVASMYYCGPDFPAVRQAIKETLYATGIDLIVLEEGLDTRAVSRKEVEDYFEAKRCEMHAEIMFAWRKKQGAGFRLTNSVPFGYIRRNGESNMIKDEEVAPYLSEAFSRYASGRKMRDIAKWLNEQGVDPPMKHKKRILGKPYDAEPDQWTTDMLRCLFRNPTYTGAAANGSRQIIAENCHEPYITKEQFHAFPCNLREGENKISIRKSYKKPNPLAKHIVCTCGRALCWHKDKKTGEELFYCRYCRAHKENGKNLKVPAATIYKNVMDALELEHLEEEKLAAAIQQGAGKKAIEVVRAERSVQMKSVLAELNMEQFRRVPLYESYMANEITEEQYHAELMDYEEAHRKLNEQLTAIMEDTLVWERALSLRNPWIQQMAQYKAPEELDRSFVKKYIEQVTVTLLGDGQAEIGLTMKTYEWKQMLGRIETEETDDGTKE